MLNNLRYVLTTVSLCGLAVLSSCAGTKAVKPTVVSVPVFKAHETGMLPLNDVDSLLLLQGEPNRDIARESFLRALMFENLDKPQLAEPFLKRALAHEPKNRFLAFDLVSVLVQNGRAKEALAIAQRAERYPGEPNAEETFLLAHMYRENSMLDSCISYYEKTIALSPTHLRALYEYSVVLELMQDYKSLARIYQLLLPMIDYPKSMVDKELMLLKMPGSPDSALVDFLAQVYQAKGDGESGKALVEALVERNRHAEALDVVKQILQTDPANRELWMVVVRLEARTGNAAGAIVAQHNVYALDTTQLDELERLGMIEFEMGQLDSARVHFQRLVGQRPEDHLAWYYCSNLAQAKGDTVQAFTAIHKAMALKPDALTYRNQLASLYARLNKFDSAQVIADESIVLHPESPLAQQFKGDLLIRQAFRLENQWPAAESPQALQARDLRSLAQPYLRKAWQMDTLATEVLFDLASNTERLDSIDLARQYFERILVLNPRHGHALNYLGYLLVERNLDVSRGALLVDSALATDSTNVAYLDSKGWVLATQGKWEAARDLFAELVKKPDADDVTIWEHTALVYDHLQDKSKALAAWKRVLKLNAHHKQALQRVKALGP